MALYLKIKSDGSLILGMQEETQTSKKSTEQLVYQGKYHKYIAHIHVTPSFNLIVNKIIDPDEHIDDPTELLHKS